MYWNTFPHKVGYRVSLVKETLQRTEASNNGTAQTYMYTVLSP